jgi:hypothetical protein
VAWPPPNTLPSASPTTQTATTSTMARTSTPRRTGGGANTPTATTASSTANTIDAATPWPSTRPAATLSIATSQRGWPLVIDVIMSCMPWLVRLSGSIANQASEPHSTSHNTRAAATPTGRSATVL